jgi:hypothetical protein
MYNRLRRKKKIEKVTEIDQDKFPDELINKKTEPDLMPVIFVIRVNLDSFLYTIPKNRYDFLKVEEEQVLGKEHKDWAKEERESFLWKIRSEARLIDSRSPDPRDFDCMPDEVMTELEKSYARRKKRGTLADLEDMRKKNDKRK